jgi:serine/threonine-protein kinase RsbW
MEAETKVEFSLPAKAENVPLVRHALSGVAEAVDMEASAIADLKTVVTEACMNVVIHAYEGAPEPGPLLVSAWPYDSQLVVRVADQGRGIRPLADVEQRSLRLGLPLIAALTESFEISGAPGRGTSVTMRVSLAGVGDEPPAPGEAPAAETPDETRITLPANDLLAPVLSRVISMFAARADFSVDQLSDAVLLSDALSAQGPDRFPEGRARIAVSEHPRSFSVRVGPLSAGGGQRLLEGLRIPTLDASLEGLAEEVRVERSSEGESLVVRIGRPA